MAKLSSIMKAFGGGAPAIYTALGDLSNLYGGKHYLNYGYWRDGESDPGRAADELARLVGRLAELSADDEVLDVGFGFGEQDILWAQEFGCRKIVGIDITAVHIERGNSLVNQRGLGERVFLALGDATSLDFQDSSFDKVIALECAMHFRTRESFFKEAFRVLKPGGRLAATDVGYGTSHIDKEFVRSRGIGIIRDMISAKVIDRFWQIPKANKYDMDTYEKLLQEAGFRSTEITNITADVYPPFAGLLRRYVDEHKLSRVDGWVIREFARILEHYPTYYTIVALKPSHSTDKEGG